MGDRGLGAGAGSDPVGDEVLEAVSIRASWPGNVVAEAAAGDGRGISIGPRVVVSVGSMICVVWLKCRARMGRRKEGEGRAMGARSSNTERRSALLMFDRKRREKSSLDVPQLGFFLLAMSRSVLASSGLEMQKKKWVACALVDAQTSQHTPR